MVAALDRTEIQECVRLLVHVRKAGRSAHLAAETHFHVVIGADRDRRNVDLTAKYDIQDSCDHFALRVLIVGIQIEPIYVYYTELAKTSAWWDSNRQ